MIENFLKSIPLFQDLPESEIQYLAESLTHRGYPTGTLIVREAHPASRFFILLEGQVEVIKAIGTKDERLLAVRKAGTFIGEMGLLSEDGLHTATVRAQTPIVMFEMSQEEFDALLHRHPSLGYSMVRTLSRRLNQSENLTIRDLRRKNRELVRAYQELEAAQAAIIEKERLERELEVAREIQSSILPHRLPERPGYDFGALMMPMSAVGGDFFDFIPLGENRLGIAVGDISDHGVPAALFMTMTVTLLRAEARRGVTPREALLNVNHHLLEINETGMFATVLFGVLDYDQQVFSYVRAGHELPAICDARANFIQLPRGLGQLIGILAAPDFDEQSVDLYPGNMILLYTDGVNEATNSRGELFGVERLRATVAEICQNPAQVMCEQVFGRLADHRGTAMLQDDITMVIVKVK